MTLYGTDELTQAHNLEDHSCRVWTEHGAEDEAANPVPAIEESAPRSTGRPVGGRPPLSLVIPMFAGNVGCAVIFDVLPPILPALSAHFGGGEHGDLVAQLASTLPIFGMALSGLISGPLIERLGIKHLLGIALLVFATVGSSGLFLNAAPILLATRLLVGVATGMMITCRTSLIAVSYTGRARARMTGYTFGVGAVSAVILVLVSGAAAHLSWRAPFALHAVIGAVFIIPVLALKAIPSIGVGADSVARGALETFRHLKPAATAYCLIFVVVLIANLFSIQITFLLVQAGITSPATIANVCVGNVLAIALSNAVYGRIEARLGVVRTTQSVFACLAIGASLCASSLSLPQFIAGTFIGGIGVGLGVPAAINPIMRRTSLILAARALSIATTVMYLGGATAPVLYAPIRVAVGLHGVYYFAAIAILFGLIMFRVRSPITGT